MHITNTQVQMQSQHSLHHSEQRVNLRQRLPDQPSVPAPKPQQISSNSAAPADADSDSGCDLETSLLKALVEAMSGRRIDLMQMTQSPASAESSAPAPQPTQAPANSARFLRVDATQIQEMEITQVQFSGQFSTEDGRTISLNLQYSLQRSYSATTFSANVSGANPKDPLALNFDGLGVALDPGGTQFDIDSDNVIDALPTLRAGSAYLALDRNGDGVINNGSELFGATSGDGYGELAQFDIDGNFFIDEADPIFAQLQLFRPGESTQALGKMDIGAIFLGNIASPARLTDTNNQSLGQLRSTGFYLTNDGTAGLVQQIDLMA